MPVLGVLGEVCRPATVCFRRARGGGAAVLHCFAGFGDNFCLHGARGLGSAGALEQSKAHCELSTKTLAPRATSELLLLARRQESRENSLACACLLPGGPVTRGVSGEASGRPRRKEKGIFVDTIFRPPSPSKFYTVHLVQRQPRTKKTRFAESLRKHALPVCGCREFARGCDDALPASGFRVRGPRNHS